MARTYTIAAAALGLLAACGGGGGSDVPMTQAAPKAQAERVASEANAPEQTKTPATRTDAPEETEASAPSPDSQAETLSRAQSLLARYDDRVTRERFADPDALPTRGAARFDGTAGLSIGGATVLSDTDALANAALLSRLALRLDFERNALSGRIDEVFDKKSGADYDGSLAISGGLRRGTDPADEAGLRGRAEGTLTKGAQRLDMTLSLSGDVLSGGDAVAGGLTGVARSGSGAQTVHGGFLADR